MLSLEFLHDIPLFADLPAELESVVANESARKQFRPQAVVISPAEQVPFLGVVLSGYFGSLVQRADGGEFLLSPLLPGDLFGNLEKSGDPVTSLSTICLEKGEVLMVGSSALQRVAALPWISDQLLATSQKRVARLVQHLRLMTHVDVEDKILGYLTALAEAFRLNDARGRHIPLRLTQQMIADACNLSRETVSRRLSSLVNQERVLRTDFGWVLPRCSGARV
jgi:CRP-like cAMP-binding protein